MGIHDIPIRAPDARALLERDVAVLMAAAPKAFRFERTQWRFEAALSNGLAQREEERLLRLVEPPRFASRWRHQFARVLVSTRVALTAGVLATAALGVVIGLSFEDSPPNSIQWLAAEQSTHSHQLEDGSSIVMARGTQGRLATGDDVHFALDHGAVQFDVAKRRERQWRITAADYEVTVVGTRFDVSYEPDGPFEVAVQRGTVQVRVPGHTSELQLDAGDSLTALNGQLTLRHGWQAAVAHMNEDGTRDDAQEAEASAEESYDESSSALNPVVGARLGDKSEVKRSATGRAENTELQLLTRARTALARQDNDAAMRWLGTHRKLYPKGQLTEEREALRVETLRRMGQDKEADRAAGDFRERFPKSVLSPQMPAKDKATSNDTH